MSLVRFLPAPFHAVADYAVGLALITVAIATTNAADDTRTLGIVVGATVLVVSMLTKYPLGVIKVLPFRIHSAGDYLAAALLIGGASALETSPYSFDFNNAETGLGAFYVITGFAVLAVSLITNYQYSPRRRPAMTSEPQREREMAGRV